MSVPAGFVWDPRLAAHVYREDHPLKPWRLRGVHDTLERLGAFANPRARLLAPRDATRAEIERIHDPAYVDTVVRASAEPDRDYSAWGLSAHGDTFFPPLDTSEWLEVERRGHPADERHRHPFAFVTLERARR